MVDTIILILPYGRFLITKPDNFTPAARDLQKVRAVFMKFYNNPTAESKRLGVYNPRLTLYKRGGTYELKIEFSAAKLIYKNNLQELASHQFGQLVEILQRKMETMGVLVTIPTLKEASVASFHPSKNIPINGGYSAVGAIREISKINLTGKLDLDKTKFRNDGHSLQFYAKSHALVFYDKMQDLEKTEKRSLGKDQKMQQQSLFDFLKRPDKPEILRIEVRLSEKQKMNDVLQKLGYSKNPTFQDIFKTKVCQKVLLYYYDTYITPNLFVFDLSNDPQAILKRLLRSNKKIKIKQAVYLVGLWLLCKDEGIRTLRKVVQPTKQKIRNWQRIAGHFKDLNALARIDRSHSFIKDIRDSFKKFQPYHFEDVPLEPKPKPFDPWQYH